jgi:septum formation protein
VTFRTLSPGEVQAYVASGEPLDKAGAYGLQGRGGGFVTRVEGNPQTVIGLPVELLERLLGDSAKDQER